jgi:hypothetical protein
MLIAGEGSIGTSHATGGYARDGVIGIIGVSVLSRNRLRQPIWLTVGGDGTQ